MHFCTKKNGLYLKYELQNDNLNHYGTKLHCRYVVLVHIIAYNTKMHIILIVI